MVADSIGFLLHAIYATNSGVINIIIIIVSSMRLVILLSEVNQLSGRLY